MQKSSRAHPLKIAQGNVCLPCALGGYCGSAASKILSSWLPSLARAAKSLPATLLHPPLAGWAGVNKIIGFRTSWTVHPQEKAAPGTRRGGRLCLPEVGSRWVSMTQAEATRCRQLSSSPWSREQAKRRSLLTVTQTERCACSWWRVASGAWLPVSARLALKRHGATSPACTAQKRDSP